MRVRKLARWVTGLVAVAAFGVAAVVGVTAAHADEPVPPPNQENPDDTSWNENPADPDDNSWNQAPDDNSWDVTTFDNSWN